MRGKIAILLVITILTLSLVRATHLTGTGADEVTSSDTVDSGFGGGTLQAPLEHNSRYAVTFGMTGSGANGEVNLRAVNSLNSGQIFYTVFKNGVVTAGPAANSSNFTLVRHVNITTTFPFAWYAEVEFVWNPAQIGGLFPTGFDTASSNGQALNAWDQTNETISNSTKFHSWCVPLYTCYVWNGSAPSPPPPTPPTPPRTLGGENGTIYGRPGDGLTARAKLAENFGVSETAIDYVLAIMIIIIASVGLAMKFGLPGGIAGTIGGVVVTIGLGLVPTWMIILLIVVMMAVLLRVRGGSG